jgi:hypothetical protein
MTSLKIWIIEIFDVRFLQKTEKFLHHESQPEMFA